MSASAGALFFEKLGEVPRVASRLASFSSALPEPRIPNPLSAVAISAVNRLGPDSVMPPSSDIFNSNQPPVVEPQSAVTGSRRQREGKRTSTTNNSNLSFAALRIKTEGLAATQFLPRPNSAGGPTYASIFTANKRCSNRILIANLPGVLVHEINYFLSEDGVFPS